MSKKKIAVVGAVAVVAAIAGVYFGGRYYYTNHFYPNTTIGGIDCGNKTAEAIVDSLEKKLSDYQLTIHDSVTDMQVSSEDAGLEYKNIDIVSETLKKQNLDLWFTELMKDNGETAVETSLDTSKLDAYLDTLECMNPSEVIEPVNAEITYHKDSNSFEIDAETIGNVVDTESFYPAVEEAVLQGETELDMTTNEYYQHPKYMSDSKIVTAAKEKLDKYMSSVITYKHGSDKYKLDAEEIHDFLKVSKKFKITFDEEAIQTFIADKLCTTFNTMGSTRTIYSPGSGNITISGGDYGWRVSLDQETAQIKKDIKTGTAIKRKPLYLQEAKQHVDGNDIGDTFVDVNISQQTLYYVKDGSVAMSSEFVSGNVVEGHETHKGVYWVEFKRTNYGMPKYNVTVAYWIPFNTGEGEGFHDATWRSTFGGSYYYSTGSHGCINLPYWAAQYIYYNIPCETPVIVH